MPSYYSTMNNSDQELEANSSGGMSGQVNGSDTKRAELAAWQTVSSALSPLSGEAQARVLKSIITIFDIPIATPQINVGGSLQTSATSSPASDSFSKSDDRLLSPKEFLHEKRPATDVDKVACLAYYLAHYRNTQFFKTLDISQLNTEAAQVKFSNPTQAVDNATKAELLVPAAKGQKQISAAGELYVQSLPDKDAAKAAIEGFRRKRTRRVSAGTKIQGGEGE